jgi:hypothetical protein
VISAYIVAKPLCTDRTRRDASLITNKPSPNDPSLAPPLLLSPLLDLNPSHVHLPYPLPEHSLLPSPARLPPELPPSSKSQHLSRADVLEARRRHSSLKSLTKLSPVLPALHAPSPSLPSNEQPRPRTPLVPPSSEQQRSSRPLCIGLSSLHERRVLLCTTRRRGRVERSSLPSNSSIRLHSSMESTLRMTRSTRQSWSRGNLGEGTGG